MKSLLDLFPAYRRLHDKVRYSIHEQLKAEEALEQARTARDKAAAERDRLHNYAAELAATIEARELENKLQQKSEKHLREQLSAQMKDKAAARARRDREHRAGRADALKAEDVLAAFNVPEGELWFTALLQELDGMIEEAIRAAEPVAITAEQRTHATGAVFALRDLRERLCALRTAATRKDGPAAEQDDERAA